MAEADARARLVTHMPVSLTPTWASVVVVGAGAGGCAVAGELARGGLDVLLVEAGPRLTPRLGQSLRNDFLAEDDQERYASLLEQTLVPHAGEHTPIAALPGQRGVHAVGGMLIAWTNNCPEPHPALERESAVSADQWRPLLERARRILCVSILDDGVGIRQQRIIARLQEMFSDLPAGRAVQAMPVAAKLRAGRVRRWSGADTLLYGEADCLPNSLRVVDSHVARRLLHRAGRVTAVQLHAKDGGPAIRVEADAFVVAAGAVGTPQLLAASKVSCGPALGRYIMEHSTVGARFVLDPAILADVPAGDPAFAVWIPLSERRDRHVQLYRFASKTTLPQPYKPQDTADIVSSCGQDPDPDNRLIFDDARTDDFGLPVVSARFELSRPDRARIGEALADQFAIVAELGVLVHGFAPTVWRRGASLHLAGSHRIGARDDGESVANGNGRVWGYDNLYVAGNGVFSRRTACNPTLSMIALALHCADGITAG